LFLCGRNRERLEGVAEGCRKEGAAAVYAEVLDVNDAEAARDWLVRSDSIAPLERIFSNAGIGTGIEDEANVRQTWATNVGGNINIVLPAINIFRARKVGDYPHRQILVTSSIAGYGPIASCPAYSGSKAAMKTWALALRGMLKKEGIKVSAICPGFVRSRITDRNTCPMPFFMEADKAARIILKRADKNVGLIAFPWPMRLATWFLSILPFRVNEFINSLLPEKTHRADSSPNPLCQQKI
jgi:short-subunit dehydrogenase